jgi:hypothetical protein
VAEEALAQHKFVTVIDVLVGLGWLEQRRLDEWRQGRADSLEAVVVANVAKISTALRALGAWAREQELQPNEAAYVARGRARRPLRFSKSGDPSIERAYRTHWVSPELSEAKRARLAERQARPPDLIVISPNKEFTCSGCGTVSGELLVMEDAGPICMVCAEMDHLVLLPAGDAALTRRAKAASGLTAVVVRFSRARGRYERQGVLVEEQALEQAEEQCLADEDARARRRERDLERRPGEDRALHERMAQEIGRLFPGCPAERTLEIARHAALRGSGRIGRTAAGRALDPAALELAVIASIRHRDTRYDELLMADNDRASARAQVRDRVDQVLEDWRHG